MRNVRKYNNFSQAFLTQNQKIMLKYMEKNVIKEINSEGESEEEKDIDERIAKNLSSSNTMVVMFTIAELVKILKPYTE